MRIAFLDCFSGVAGDMWVAALLDLGLELGALDAAVSSLRLAGVRLEARRVRRGVLSGMHFRVALEGEGHHGDRAEQEGEPHDSPQGGDAHHGHAHQPAPGHAHQHAHQHAHRHLDDILAILERADLPSAVRTQAAEVFEVIARAEAKVHGRPIEEIHFHEVGAEDTIVDVVCAVLGSHLLGIERFYCGAVELGCGTVACEHGVMPVPAPGTLGILEGIPVRSGRLAGERTTPTGAALLRVLVHEFEPRLVWVPGKAGYGAGTRDDPEQPNLLRITLGELRDPGAEQGVTEITCNVDTATGETLGWLLDGLLRLGAVDAFASAVHMKKGRPGWQLTALAPAGLDEAVVRFLLEESSTLGVRTHHVQRVVLERWTETVATELGTVRCKLARLPSGRVVRRPEDDEIARLVRERGMSRGEVLARLALR